MAAKRNVDTGKATRVIGYARVSTAGQSEDGVSLDAQEARIRGYCAGRGLDLVELVREGGESGGTPFAARPAAGRIVEAVAAGAIGGVVTCKLDRLFRDACDCLNVTKEWDAQGVALHILDMNVDTGSPMGRMFLTMAAGFAELERRMIGQRTSDALRQVKAEGGRIGRPGLGEAFTDDTDANGRRMLAPVADEAETVTRILALRASGHTLRDIAGTLTAEGRKTKRGGKWQAETVNKVLARAGAVA